MSEVAEKRTHSARVSICDCSSCGRRTLHHFRPRHEAPIWRCTACGDEHPVDLKTRREES
jgi:ribosomal protein L37AE/L43A